MNNLSFLPNKEYTNEKNFKNNETAWFINPYNQMPESGIILTMHNTYLPECADYAIYAFMLCNPCGYLALPLSELYRTKDECEASLPNDSQKTKDRRTDYESKINSVEDLVQFMYSHNIHPHKEYADWDAREIVQKKAKELLHIEL